MPDAMESTRILSLVFYIAFALRHEPDDRNIYQVSRVRRFGVIGRNKLWSLFKARIPCGLILSTRRSGWIVYVPQCIRMAKQEVGMIPVLGIQD